MQMAFAFLVIYTALASACYVPFNDVRFLNSTFFSEFLANDTSHPDTGWASVVLGDTFRQPWPKVPEPPTDLPGTAGLITIPYCYRTAKDREDLQETFKGGVKIWRNGLSVSATIVIRMWFQLRKRPGLLGDEGDS